MGGRGRLTFRFNIQGMGVERSRTETETQYRGDLCKRRAGYSQSTHGMAEWIGGGVIRDGPRKARSVQV